MPAPVQCGEFIGVEPLRGIAVFCGMAPGHGGKHRYEREFTYEDQHGRIVVTWES